MTPLAWAGVITSVVVLAVGVGIVWVGTLNDADGDPLIADPGGVLIAIIGAISLVAAAAIPLLRQMLSHLENDHKDAEGKPLGLRDDLDDKHATMRSDIRRLTRIALATQRDVAWLMRRQAETDERVDALEDTANPKERS